jgi:hypothetical protein
MRAAYQKYHDQGFEILSVSLDDAKKKSPEEVKRYTRDNGMIWRHIDDGLAFKGPLAKAYHVSGIPAPFLIGRDGSLQGMGPEVRGESLAPAVERALSKKPS